jgi:hypothetical protein
LKPLQRRSPAQARGRRDVPLTRHRKVRYAVHQFCREVTDEGARAGHRRALTAQMHSRTIFEGNPYSPLSAGAIRSRLKRRPQWAGPLASSMYWGLLNFPVSPRFLWFFFGFRCFLWFLLTLNFVQIFLVLIKKCSNYKFVQILKLFRFENCSDLKIVQI